MRYLDVQTKTDETILTPQLSNPVSKIELTVVGIQDQAHSIHDINSIAWCRRLVPEDADEGSASYKKAQLAQQRTRGLLATAADDGSVKVWQSNV
jgi:hypothetical protein